MAPINLIITILTILFPSDAHDDDFGGDSFAYDPFYKPPDIPKSAYFAESFSSQDEFNSRWITSRSKKDNSAKEKYDGEWRLEEPMERVLTNDRGLVMKSKSKHHAISVGLDRPFVFDGRSFVVQFEVKLQKGLECGGAYMKLLMQTEELDLRDFHDRTPFVVMFGPDKCGNDMKIHFIFRHKSPVTNVFKEVHSRSPTGLEEIFGDRMTHLYTLVIHPNNSFVIMVDMETLLHGNLLHDMQPPINPPEQISDPEDTKPLDWDDRETIPDPDATKPDNWEEISAEYIPDSNAKVPDGWLVDEQEWVPDERALKPRDWDDDMDGQWEPPLILNPLCEKSLGCGEWNPPFVKNPKFKGGWTPPTIRNPAYKGSWAPRKIANPNYFYDPLPYNMSTIGALGLELWSVTPNILFDDIIITDSLHDAKIWAGKSWKIKSDIEKMRYTASRMNTVDAIVEAANERPWLWIIIILAIVMPTLFFISCCCVPPDSNKSGRSKKFDGPSYSGPKLQFDARVKGHSRLRNNVMSRNDFERTMQAYRRAE